MTATFSFDTFVQSISNVTKTEWASLIAGLVCAYVLKSAIYMLYFHPLAKYPGPRLAAISDLWYSYHMLGGRWPYVIERALEKYGDVVRIGPNDLYFIDPQAFLDIHSAKTKMAGQFVKTDLDGFGDGDNNGLLWERDPAKHREVSKKVSPAFKSKSIKEREPTMQGHIDGFVNRMKECGDTGRGVELRLWAEWLAMDISSNLTYNREMQQVDKSENSLFLTGLQSSNFLASLIIILKKYPILKPIAMPLIPLFVPMSVVRSLLTVHKDNLLQVERRIAQQGNTKHPDYFDVLLPLDQPVPTDEKDKKYLGTLTSQLVLAGFDSVSVSFFMPIYFLLQDPDLCRRLARDIRHKFPQYSDIDSDTLAQHQYLNACLHEAFRLSATATASGTPRASPGATVNGDYIPKGVICHSSTFAYGRSSRYFHDSLRFRPERWLTPDHPDYNSSFSRDDHRGHLPFLIGPRQCPGREVGWMGARLFLAKVLWSFDIELAPGQELKYDKDFDTYAMWIKPQTGVRFMSVER